MTSHRFRDKLIIMTLTDTNIRDAGIETMLDALPDVFGIEDMVAALSVTEREAVHIADIIERENGTVMGGHNRWIKLHSQEYMAGYHKLGTAGTLERLEAFYGEHLRRINGLRALEYCGVTLTSTLSAASNKIADEDYTLKKFKILHKYESYEFLTLHSEQVDNKTWASSIERCLLELADEMSGTTVMEYLMVGIEVTGYSAGKILSAALDLEYTTALRKIGSIIRHIPENHCLPKAAHEIADLASEIDGDWEEISNVVGKNKTPVIEDEDFKIIWRVLPEDIYSNTLT